MDKDTLKGIKDFLLLGVVLAAVLYSTTTAWKNGEKLTGLESEMKGVKESLIVLVLEDRPNKIDLATKLLSNVTVIEGLDEFKEKNYESAFSLWSEAALNGDESSAFAIYAAKIKLNDEIKVLPEGEVRESLLKAVSFAPEVVKEGDNYILSAQVEK
ncbi:TPA: hypothetical protein ACMDX1_004404 [Vibrio parahaemolyticus]|uniref:hypothetical protein n=1 Tax=Vibrio parahaemolyticus TaxID=670 RepID=UPI001A229443|nr:hypothetical protein [Vibrio parahaemolyticus]MDX8425303.1 hypothetical protein [Vibrio parahaemolyticus]HAS6834635.1 hypothetical protein [Vibrio parahaemolyticus]HAS6943406.1 hypothetical protein [Vibrio parahaemolyticus]